MKKGVIVSEEKAESLDSNKRFTKNVSENISKCDSIVSSAKSFSCLFIGQAIAARTRLRESCERAIMSGSLLNKQKIEEILWRKVYYDPLSTAKKFRQGSNWSDTESGLIWAHLNDGIAYYHQLLIIFCFTFSIPSDLTADLLPIYNQDEDQTTKPSEASLKDSFFRSLTCLGDLTRYKLDLPSQNVDDSSYLLSVRYYHQALHYNSEGGLTHSNLATVYSTNCQPLLAAVHYLRAITCEKPFEAAENNLRRMLDRSRIWLENKKLQIENSNEIDLGKESKQFLHTCLALVSYLMNNKKTEEVALLCQDVLVQLGKLLDEYDNSEPSDFSESSSEGTSQEVKINGHNNNGFGDSFKSHFINKVKPQESSGVSFIVNPESMVTLCSLFIVCVKRLKIQASSHSNMSEVLLVSVLLTLVTHINTRLEQRFSLIDPAFVNNLIPVIASVDHDNEKDTVEETDKEPEKITCNGIDDESKKKKNKLSKLRRRMKNTDSKDNESDPESDIDLNENETNDKLNDDSSSCSDDNYDSVLCSSEDEYSDDDVKIESDQEEWQGISADEHLQLIEQEGMLAAVYVTLFWLFNNEEMIKLCSKDGLNLWSSIAKLSNLVHVDYDKVNTEPDSLESIIVDDMKPFGSFSSKGKSLPVQEDDVPLPENLMLHLVIPSFRVNGVVRNLKTSEQNLLRLYRLNVMIHSLALRDDTPLVLEDNKFHVKKIVEKTEIDKVAEGRSTPLKSVDKNDESAANAASKKSRVTASMQSLTAQWLQHEVRNLEERTSRKVKMGGLYVVPDAAVLIYHLAAIKRMLATPSHMIIIPQVVIDSLDLQKKESVGARDAIRWLEVKFRHGSRFIRAQRLHERTRLPLIKYPKRKDKEAWEWFHLAECCYYLGAQMSNMTKLKTATVTLLAGENPNKSPKLSFSTSTLTEAAGAVLQSVDEFTRKWQISSIGHS